MSYNPSSDFLGLWRSVSGGVEKAEMPGLDYVIAALARAGLLRVVTSQTAPVTNQQTTAWFRPTSPSFTAEGALYLWSADANTYVPATPELFHTMLAGGDTVGGSGDPVPEAPNDGNTYGRKNLTWVAIGSGGSSFPEAPNDGKQYGRQSLTWTEVEGADVIPPGTGADDMAIISGTAPSNPTSGTQWWNGTIMQVWDGSQWKLVGPPSGPGGVALETSTLVFAMSQSQPITLPAGAWTIINYTDAPLVDAIPDSWDAVTKKYTPKKPGYYAVNLRAWPGTGQGGCAILKNDDGVYDSNVGDVVIAMSLTSTPTVNSCTGIVQMNGTTDYVRCFAWNAGALLNAPGSSPVFSLLRLP